MIHIGPFMIQPSEVIKEVKCCSTNDTQLEVELCPCLTSEKDSYTYQWYTIRGDKTEFLFESEHYHGVDTPKLTIKNLKQEHEGEYYCKVTVGESSPISSKRANLTIKLSKSCYDHTICIDELSFCFYSGFSSKFCNYNMLAVILVIIVIIFVAAAGYYFYGWYTFQLLKAENLQFSPCIS